VRRKVMMQARKQRGPTVAITGAGSGLGRELALGFSAKGYQVFGTALSESKKTNQLVEVILPLLLSTSLRKNR